MTKTIAYVIMIVASAVWLVLSVCSPWVLGDGNTFLKNFVSSDLLTLLGVIVSITLASAANLHLTVNKLEEEDGNATFDATRASIKQSATWLIGMLVVAVGLVVAKPLMCPGETKESLVNGAALLIVLFNILVLTDLVLAVFTIKPRKK